MGRINEFKSFLRLWWSGLQITEYPMKVTLTKSIWLKQQQQQKLEGRHFQADAIAQ